MKEIKAIVFDMDGVLIDAREWHFEALNEALSYFDAEITEQEHLDKFDGLPTRKKLTMLTAQGRLPEHVHDIVEIVKQDRTLRLASNRLYPSVRHQIMLAWLKERGYKLGVATNSIKMTADHMLTLARISQHLDCTLTNQDVKNPKPDPEIYNTAAKILEVQPQHMLVIEDSNYGVRAATDAGAQVIKVSGPRDVSLDLIRTYLEE